MTTTVTGRPSDAAAPEKPDPAHRGGDRGRATSPATNLHADRGQAPAARPDVCSVHSAKAALCSGSPSMPSQLHAPRSHFKHSSTGSADVNGDYHV